MLYDNIENHIMEESMAKFKGQVKQCVICGKQFRVPPSRAQQLYCSVACSYKSGERYEKIKKPLIPLKCPQCGKDFHELLSQSKHRVYCSLECKHSSLQYKELKKMLSSGENNGMWKGGGTNHADGYKYAYAPQKWECKKQYY